MKLFNGFRTEIFVRFLTPLLFNKANYLSLIMLCWLSLVLVACSPDAKQNITNASVQSTPTILNAATVTNTANSIKLTINITSPQAPSYPPSVVTTLIPSIATSNLTASDWKYRWLKGIPCRAPCWEGITPGKTTMQEALDLLKQNSLVMGTPRVGPISHPEEGSTEFIDWEWTKLPAGYTGGYIVVGSELSAGKVVRIVPGYRTAYRLGDVIKMYGEPSYIAAGYQKLENHSFYGIAVTFSSQGLFLYFSATEKPLINADLSFEPPTALLIFFVPGEEAYPKVPYYDEYNKYRKPWSGYNTFDFYCRTVPGSGNDCKDA